MQGKPFDNNTKAFLALVRAGIWESEVQLLPFGEVDYSAVLRLAEEQSVVGLVAAGLEHVDDVKVRKEYVLQFVGQTLQLEQRNTAMNSFIGVLVDRMREADIYSVLVKGQGIAQCYERPLWRASGDIDFLLSPENYSKAKQFLLPFSSANKPDERYSKHLGLNIDPWYVEIHGSLRTGLSSRLDKEIDKVQEDVFYGENVRSWLNYKTTVFLPSPNNDIFFVFTHFIKHFYKEGMTIRQICDWCRLMWTYKDHINSNLLEKRLRKSNLMTEWRAFAALAVEHLGMPIGSIPLYDDGKKWSEKGKKIILFILNGYSGNRLKDTCCIMKIFPWKTVQYLPSVILNVNLLKIRESIWTMIIDKALLDQVTEQAKNSPRLRMNFNFHQSLDEKCHRFLNAVEPGTVVPIHRHPSKDESFVLLRGRVRVTTHNDDGSIKESVVLNPAEGLYGVDIPKGVWHKVESIETGSCFFECKEGLFVPHEEDGILEIVK